MRRDQPVVVRHLRMDQLTGERDMDDTRILLLSHRNLYEQEAWRGACRELEAVMAEVDAVDVIAPKQDAWYGRRKQNAQRVGKYTTIGLNPCAEKVSLKKDYALL